MADKPLPDHVPDTFKGFFWDVNFDTLSPKTHPYYVINRLLDKGDLEAARWVVRTFPKDMIVHTFKTIRDFTPWTGTFWQRYLNIPKEEVACLHPSYRAMRSTLWPY